MTRFGKRLCLALLSVNFLVFDLGAFGIIDLSLNVAWVVSTVAALFMILGIMGAVLFLLDKSIK